MKIDRYNPKFPQPSTRKVRKDWRYPAYTYRRTISLLSTLPKRPPIGVSLYQWMVRDYNAWASWAFYPGSCKEAYSTLIGLMDQLFDSYRARRLENHRVEIYFNEWPDTSIWRLAYQGEYDFNSFDQIPIDILGSEVSIDISIPKPLLKFIKRAI